MFRLNYTDLTKEQVEKILAKSKPPVCASGFCGRLSGKTLKIVLDKTPVEGPELEYEFKSETKLMLRENSGAPVECDYGALSQKNITLFSHMIPDTKKGYNVIINWETSVVTVYEMWFVDYEPEKIDLTKSFYAMGDASKTAPVLNREVQRQYYFGYVEMPGQTPPQTRDNISARIENYMIKWKEDRGKHSLTTYTSTVFSTQVILDTPDGGDVLTFASDILRINDSTYIYCFGEVEFSGRLSVEVLDIFGMKKIGVTMGIDENDEFEHALYKGKGKYLGRYATFYDFNDRGDQYSDFIKNRVDSSVKGARATYRPSVMTKKVTENEIIEASKKPVVFGVGAAPDRVMFSTHVLDDTGYCVGKELTFSGDDGYMAELRFKTMTELEYRAEGDSEWRSEQYRAVELDEDLIVFGFYRSGVLPSAVMVFALDFKNGCATCVSAKMGSKYDVHDPVPCYHFGVFETEGIRPLRIFRHGFTNELLGRAFTQTYSDNMSSIHIYNAPHSYSWTIINLAGPGTPANRAGGFVWSSPCEYIKLRDDVFVMNWVEQKWSGHMDTLFRNLRTGRDCGFAYGLSYDGKEIHLDKMGSFSRSAGYIDLSGVYSLNNYNTQS